MGKKTTTQPNGTDLALSRSNTLKEGETVALIISNLDDDIRSHEMPITKRDTISTTLNKYSQDLLAIYKIDSSICEALPAHFNLNTDNYQFGLNYITQDGKVKWLNNDKPVYKQLTELKAFPFRVNFRAKKYPNRPADLACNLVKYLIFLQIRRDLLNGRLVVSSDRTDFLVQLGSLIYQIEDGDAPSDLMSQVDSAQRKKMFLHSNAELDTRILKAYSNDLTGTARTTALNEFLRLASSLPTYGADSYIPEDMVMLSIGNLNEDIPPVKKIISKKATAQTLFDMYCDELGEVYHITHDNSEQEARNLKEIMKSEKNYFGLRYSDSDGKLHWLENDKSVYKQLSDAGAKSQNSGNSYKITFRMKHYPIALDNLKCNLSHFLFYLQIRRDLIQGRLICPSDNPDTTIKVGSLIYQIEEGPATFATLSELNEQLKDPENSERLKKKIFLYSSDTLENQILLAYAELKTLPKAEAVSNLLQLVTTFPTYGIDPFQVVPLFLVKHETTAPNEANGDVSHLNANTSMEASKLKKLKRSLSSSLQHNGEKTSNSNINSSMSVSRSSGDLKKTPNYYLGISHSGLRIFVGTQPSITWPWDQIVTMRYSKNIFKVVCKGHENTSNTHSKTKQKEKKYSFQLPSPSAALAVWRWANDRKFFFTLQETDKPKVIKSSNSFLKRSKTFKFSGNSLAEIQRNVTDRAASPQPDISYSSMRIVNFNPSKLDIVNGASKTATQRTSSRPALAMDAQSIESSNANAPTTNESESPRSRATTSPISSDAAHSFEQPSTATSRSATVDYHSNQESGADVQEEIDAKTTQPLSAVPNGKVPNGHGGMHGMKANGHLASSRGRESANRGAGKAMLGLFALVGLVLAVSVFILEARSSKRSDNDLTKWAHQIRKSELVSHFADSVYEPLKETVFSAMSGKVYGGMPQKSASKATNPK